MQITRKDGKFIVEFPDTQKRCNPYDDSEDEDMDSMVGLISDYNGYKEYGLAHRIDMNYKGKSDQVGPYVVIWQGSAEEFTKVCKELNIDIIDYCKEKS